jgi:phage/plasmid-like protein (TIGR03299 family)
MASGITLVDRIYSIEGTEWHKLAIVKSTINRQEIKDILWPIIQSPSFAEVDGKIIELKNDKALLADMRGLRDDLEDQIVHLHTPKNSYQVIDNSQVWEVMETALKDLDATITSAGTLEGGKKFFISCIIGESEMVINKDRFKFYINFISSHDGTISMNVYDSSLRIVCMNTLRWSMQKAGEMNFKIQHTKNASIALQNLPQLVNAILTGRSDLKQVMEYLYNHKCDNNDALAMAAGYFVETTGNQELATRSWKAAQEIGTLFHRGIACNGETLYDLANAVTEYYTTGLGTGKSGTSQSARLYKSAMGGAAEHKEQFIGMLSDETQRTIMLDKGRSAVKTALANA